MIRGHGLKHGPDKAGNTHHVARYLYVCCCTVQVDTTDNSWRAQLNAEQVVRDAERAAASKAAGSSGQGAATVAPLPTVTVLTYNVWCALSHLPISFTA